MILHAFFAKIPRIQKTQMRTIFHLQSRRSAAIGNENLKSLKEILTMKRSLLLGLSVGLALGFGKAGAEESTFELTPSLYLFGVYGTSSADHPGEFAPGGHDPNRKEEVILQSLEPSLSLRWGEYIEGFFTGIFYTDAEDDLEWEEEEFFLKLTNLPGGLELRGGRMLNRVGFHNATHLHSWDTVDAPLAHALFLGEDGLATEGADLSVYLDTRHPTVLTLGFGQRPSHDHDHGGHDDDHGHEEDHGHDEEHDEDHDEHAHEGFEAYEAFRVSDDVFTLGLRRDQVFNDFQRLGLAAFGGFGENEGGEDSWFAGLGTEYTWRENGLEPGGRALRWRTTVMWFEGDAHAEHHEEEDAHDEHEEEHHEEAHHADDHDDEHGGDLSSWGLNTQLVYEATDWAHPFVRLDHVAEADDAGIPEWTRYSGGVTFRFADNPGASVRLQANADERGDESEQSVWLQVGLNWSGGPEVR